MREGKIIKALSGFYYVLTDQGDIVQCRGRGVFRKQKLSPLVGDDVLFQAENKQEGYILEIKERKNELIRPPIANVDQAILIFSAVEPDFSTALLDRFLIVIEFNRIVPIICITKMDLISDSKKDELKGKIYFYESAGYQVFFASSVTKEGIDSLLPVLKGKTSVFAGQSGVGKSSLLNALRPDLNLKTSDISLSLGRGRHTTRHVELIQINDGLVADTPGFSSLELTEIEEEDLNFCFPEIEKASENCKFRGCLHLHEPKCAVKEEVANGGIAGFRYEHYMQFLQEIQERKPRY